MLIRRLIDTCRMNLRNPREIAKNRCSLFKEVSRLLPINSTAMEICLGDVLITHVSNGWLQNEQDPNSSTPNMNTS